MEKLIQRQSGELDLEQRRKIVWQIEQGAGQEDGARPVINHGAANTCWQAVRQGHQAAEQQGLQQLAFRGRLAGRVERAPPHLPTLPSEAWGRKDSDERLMSSYLVQRLLLMVLTLFGVSVLIFVLLRIVPGNIADILFNSAGLIDPAEKAKIAERSGARPVIPVQYVPVDQRPVARRSRLLLRVGEAGARRDRPAHPDHRTARRLALFFSVDQVGVPFGVISAVRRTRGSIMGCACVSLSGLSLPAFWLGLLILMASSRWLSTIPIYDHVPRGFGRESSCSAIPAAAVGFRSSALIMRLTRSSMLEVLRQDYVRTARSKGTAGQVGQLRPCAAQRAAAGGHHDRHRGRHPVRRSDRHRDRVQHPGVARFLVESDPLARLPDRAEPGDADRRRRGDSQFPRRHALHGARSAHQYAESGHGHPRPRRRTRPRWRRIAGVARAESVFARGATARRHRRGRSCWSSCSPPFSPISSRRSIRSHQRLGLARPARRRAWLGADVMGRDMLRRMVHGARVSLAVGVGATLLGGGSSASTIGLIRDISAAGSTCIVQRLMDIMQALPLLVMALVIAAALGPSLPNTIVAIAIPLVPNVARVIRSNTLSLREQAFVEAARAVGIGEGRIAVRQCCRTRWRR